MATFSGFSHIALTVTNLQRSKTWYADGVCWQPLLEGTEEDGISFGFGVLAGGQVGVGLRQHPSADDAAFSPHRTGLDHISFAVESRAALEEWQRRFDSKGVTFSPIVEAPYGAVLSFKDPDGVALEAFALPGS